MRLPCWSLQNIAGVSAGAQLPVDRVRDRGALARGRLPVGRRHAPAEQRVGKACGISCGVDIRQGRAAECVGRERPAGLGQAGEPRGRRRRACGDEDRGGEEVGAVAELRTHAPREACAALDARAEAHVDAVAPVTAREPAAEHAAAGRARAGWVPPRASSPRGPGASPRRRPPCRPAPRRRPADVPRARAAPRAGQARPRACSARARRRRARGRAAGGAGCPWRRADADSAAGPPAFGTATDRPRARARSPSRVDRGSARASRARARSGSPRTSATAGSRATRAAHPPVSTSFESGGRSYGAPRSSQTTITRPSKPPRRSRSQQRCAASPPPAITRSRVRVGSRRLLRERRVRARPAARASLARARRTAAFAPGRARAPAQHAQHEQVDDRHRRRQHERAQPRAFRRRCPHRACGRRPAPRRGSSRGAAAATGARRSGGGHRSSARAALRGSRR